MGLLFIQAENAYANATHTSIVVSPWCVPVSLPLSLRQVCQSRLAFLELQSIFNRVAPRPDGPAMYGPERGARLEMTRVHGAGGTSAMTG